MNKIAYEALLKELGFSKDSGVYIINLDNINYSIFYQKEPFSLELVLDDDKPHWWFTTEHANLTSF